MPPSWLCYLLLLISSDVDVVGSLAPASPFQIQFKIASSRPVSMTRNLSTLASTNNSNDENSSINANLTTSKNAMIQSILSVTNETDIQQRRRQRRQFKAKRRPRNYWRDLSNVEQELRMQWNDCSVSIPDDCPPPIPNEALLNYWKRHDLRSAIVAHGGREQLSKYLGGAEIIPGKWVLATNTTVVQQLVAHDSNLDPEVPPLSPQQQMLKKEQRRRLDKDSRWMHSDKRKPAKYWTKKVILEEFFVLLEERQRTQNIPSVWMPRPAELDALGRTDLKQAIQRKAGGFAQMQRKAGLVRYREWKYFQGMLELQQQLIKYIYEYCDGDYTVFPQTAPMKERGYKWLYDAIHQTYGGRTFVAARLGMKYSTSRNSKWNKKELLTSDMSWGPWDLQFGVELLLFVRDDQLKRQPPLTHPVIPMPTPKKLQQRSGEQGIKLHEQVMKYGGYENVARRLGLEYFSSNNGGVRVGGNGPVIRFGMVD
jgi:hypothetical protein